MDNVRLSKIVSHALRHEPWLYELEPDEEGWVDIEQLIEGLKSQNVEWLDLKADDIEEMISRSDKKRHVIRNGKIRAIYGHSIPKKIVHEEACPPENLYHGTSETAEAWIRTEGIRPMGRQYVHLSVRREEAELVGKRKSKTPVILCIHAAEAFRSGVKFYRTNELIWLADYVPAGFVK
jgi:putative RNA 2'-phosphotransferase